MNLFEAKGSYIAIGEDGGDKKEKFTVMVEAYTYADAEAIITEEYKLFQDTTITSMKPVKISTCDVFVGEDKNYEAGDDRWYKATVSIESPDTGKKSKTTMLAKGTSIETALSCLKNGMKGTVVDWESVAIAETNISVVILK